MKRAILIFGVLLLATATRAQVTQAFLRVEGHGYSNVVIRATSASRASVRYSGGVIGMNLADLPEDVRTQLGFNPAAVAAEQARTDAAEAAASTPEAKAAAHHAALVRQRAGLAARLADTERGLQSTQQSLSNLVDKTETIYRTDTIRDGRFEANANGVKYWVNPVTQQVATGTRTIPNPDRPGLQSKCVFYQGQLTQGRADLAAIDQQLSATK